MKAQVFFATGLIITIILYLDSYHRMYDAIADPDATMFAGGIFLFGFLLTTLITDK